MDHHIINIIKCCFVLLQLTFEGIRGSNIHGDIAIDDITVTQSACGCK
jgi:hypothetical protein